MVGGWTAGKGSRTDRFGSLMVGVYDGDDLRYAGKVGPGFTEKTLADPLVPAGALRREESPFANTPRLPRRMFLVEPVPVAEVEYADWTSDGRPRHPSFKGLRPDKDGQGGRARALRMTAAIVDGGPCR